MNQFITVNEAFDGSNKFTFIDTVEQPTYEAALKQFAQMLPLAAHSCNPLQIVWKDSAGTIHANFTFNPLN